MRPGDFAETVDQHYTGLVQRLALVLHDADEAQDLAQETYLRAWRAWNRFDETDARAWLHTIGRPAPGVQSSAWSDAARRLALIPRHRRSMRGSQASGDTPGITNGGRFDLIRVDDRLHAVGASIWTSEDRGLS